MGLEDSFRELRGVWFDLHVSNWGPGRQWETAEQDDKRKADNASLRAKYDEDTEAIIRGLPRPIAPRCGNDLRGVLGREVEDDATD